MTASEPRSLHGPAPARPRPIEDAAPGPPRPVSARREAQIVQVEFKGVRRDYFAARCEPRLAEGEYVVVEADRGRDLGWVHRAAVADGLVCEGGCEHAGERPVVPPSCRVLRRAAPVDVERMLELRADEPRVRKRTRELVDKHGLKMKVSEAEWQWDRNKLTVFFTADKRVDFRSLVRDMARTFRTRIELRQIGVRDEAKRLGGVGRCRRELCCRAWLPEIQPVTLQLAKDQGLSLNPAQISGACGRLMSCLHYEHEAYLQARKRFPPEGQTLHTSRGEERVLGWNLFKETVTLRDRDGERRTVPLAELREDVRSRGGPGAVSGGRAAEAVARFYITTAIDYANGEPHVGHAFEKVGADTIARYRRLRGDEVRFVIGMDEHGQSIPQEAKKRGLEPSELVDALAARFRAAWDSLEISYDDFIRTTEPRHTRAVQALVTRVREAGDLYLDVYEGWYCVRCEAFRSEDELVDGRCPWHPDRELDWAEEENWFFRLSRFRDPLLGHIEAHPEFIRPESRRNEILRLLEGGLEDISASRSRIPWGIPFPGAEDHTVYVWIDALTNYLSAVGFPDEGYREWWPADLHVIGKDITRFHCVIWPALLLSADVELPRSVWGHGFVNVAGGKLSKSAGARLDLEALVERYGSDAFRYLLLREAPWDGDRDFASPARFLESFDGRYNAELANDLGNLLNRVVAMVEKYRQGRVPAGGTTDLDRTRKRLLDEYHEAMEAYLLHRGAEAALDLAREANVYVDRARPWELAAAERDGAEPAELDAVLGSLVRTLAACSATLAPFLPSRAAALWAQLGGGDRVPKFGDLDERTAALERVAGGRVLFPRFEAADA